MLKLFRNLLLALCFVLPFHAAAGTFTTSSSGGYSASSVSFTAGTPKSLVAVVNNTASTTVQVQSIVCSAGTASAASAVTVQVGVGNASAVTGGASATSSAFTYGTSTTMSVLAAPTSIIGTGTYSPQAVFYWGTAVAPFYVFNASTSGAAISIPPGKALTVQATSTATMSGQLMCVVTWTE